MARFRIQGGQTITGAYTPGGNKNAALPMLAAALLTDEPVTLENVPLIDDVLTTLALIRKLGASVSVDAHTIRIHASHIRSSSLDPELCRRVRSSLLLVGPLAARTGRATLFPPGGDVIGRRRIDTHFHGLRALGITMRGENPFLLRRRDLRGADILLDEASVTATENVLMTATLARGVTTLFNAACEPHVQDLCRLLVAMGAHIDGIGTNRLRIEGVDTLHGTSHAVRPDHIEIGSYLVAAAVTGGELTAHPVIEDDLRPITRVLRELGMKWQFNADTLVLPAPQRLRINPELGGALRKIEDGTWPSFPSDMMSVALVLATQSRGTALFFEKMFESRMYFVDRLIDMGANVVPCDPHRVVVVGPSRLHGIHMSSPDIRAGMALLLAALCASGESIIDNADNIDRGYERVEEKLARLGASIVREE